MNIKRTIGAGAVLLSLGQAAWAEVESNDPIKLKLHDWTGQLLTTTIMGKVLEEAGVLLGKHYPHPIVDLKESRERALAAFKSL